MNKAKKETLERGGVFIPLLFSFAAKLEDVPLPLFFRDPTKIANAVRSLHSHYRGKGVTCYCDPAIEAEALGCELDWDTYPLKIKKYPPVDADLLSRVERIGALGRIPTALEVVKRLNVMLRDVILMATITGPLTLARYLRSQRASKPNREILNLAAKATLNLTRSYGEAGLDILLFREEELPESAGDTIQTIKNLYSPIWNTAKFYEMQPALLVNNTQLENTRSLAEVVDCVVTRKTNVLTETPVRKIGYAMPVVSLIEPPSVIRSRLERDLPAEQLKSGRILLVTTDAEIPLNIDREALITGIGTIQSYIDTIIKEVNPGI